LLQPAARPPIPKILRFIWNTFQKYYDLFGMYSKNL